MPFSLHSRLQGLEVSADALAGSQSPEVLETHRWIY